MYESFSTKIFIIYLFFMISFSTYIYIFFVHIRVKHKLFLQYCIISFLFSKFSSVCNEIYFSQCTSLIILSVFAMFQSVDLETVFSYANAIE